MIGTIAFFILVCVALTVVQTLALTHDWDALTVTLIVGTSLMITVETTYILIDWGWLT